MNVEDKKGLWRHFYVLPYKTCLSSHAGLECRIISDSLFWVYVLWSQYTRLSRMSVIEDFTLVRDFCLSGTFVGLKNMISGVFGGPLVAFEQNLRDLF